MADKEQSRVVSYYDRTCFRSSKYIDGWNSFFRLKIKKLKTSSWEIYVLDNVFSIFWGIAYWLFDIVYKFDHFVYVFEWFWAQVNLFWGESFILQEESEVL